MLKLLLKLVCAGLARLLRDLFVDLWEDDDDEIYESVDEPAPAPPPPLIEMRRVSPRHLVILSRSRGAYEREMLRSVC